MKIKIKNLFSLDILLFFSVLFIGADVIGINIGVNLRFDLIFIFALLFGLLLDNGFRYKICLPLRIFLLSAFVSTITAHNFSVGLLYFSNIILNVCFIYKVFELYVKKNGIYKFINIYRNTMYIQFWLILFQLILAYSGRNLFGLKNFGYWHGFIRIPLWFYEPSYLATYLTIWSMFSLFMFLFYGYREYCKDFILSVIATIISTSTAGYLGLAVCVIILYIMLFLNKKITFKIFLSIFIILIVLLLFMNTDLYRVVVGRIQNQGIDVASGGRTIQWHETLEVFKNNFYLGVGPGNYGLYLNRSNHYVPSNVTLELLATLGLFGTTAFYSFHVILFKKVINIKNKYMYEYSVAISVALFAFILVLQANQSYLRPYHWMFLGVLNASLNRAK